LLLESKKKQALLKQTVERLSEENKSLRQKCEGLEADLLLTRQVKENLGLSSKGILDETFMTNTAQSA
jgi:predicted nuclease with TOPRIM domain